VLHQIGYDRGSKMRTKTFITIAVSLFLLGLSLRLYKLGVAPNGLYVDETAILIDMQSIVETGRDIHGNSFFQAIYPSYGDFKAPGLPITASLVALLFGVSGWSLRFVSVLAWIISTAAGLGILWILLKNTAKRSKQLLFLSFLAVTSITPWSFFFSRVAFESFLSQAWILTSAFFLLASLQNSQRKVMNILFLSLSLAFGAAAGYTYFTARYVWPAVIGLLFCAHFLQTKKKLIKFAVMLIVYLVLLLPLSRSPLYEASQALRLSTKSVISEEAKMSQVLLSNKYKDLAGNSLLSRVVFHRKVFFLQAFAQNLADHLDPGYIFLRGDSNLRHGTGKHGLLLLTFLPFFIIGSYKLWQKNKSVLFLLIGWYLVSIVPASIAEETPHAMRSLAGLFPLLTLVSFGVAEFVLFFTRSKKLWIQSLLLAWLVVVCCDIFSYYYYYFGAYQVRSVEAWQSDYVQLYDQMLNLDKELQ